MLVLASLFFDERLTFVIEPVYLVALALTAIALWQITGDGRAALYEGLALVSLGETEEGMRRVDAAAAAAVGGELTDADSIESVCCYALDACKRVRDLERANEWCLRVREIATRFGDRHMFSVCRTHYADVLLWHGEWQRADEELSAAVAELGAIRPMHPILALQAVVGPIFFHLMTRPVIERAVALDASPQDAVDQLVASALAGLRP